MTYEILNEKYDLSLTNIGRYTLVCEVVESIHN